MITREEILQNRDKEFPLSDELETNLIHLLEAVNKLRTLYAKPMYVSSGYRPGHYNTDAHGAANSTHLTCQAVDFADKDGAIKSWITLDILEKCGLYQEAPHSTPTWVHVQTRPTHSRVFTP